MSTRERWIVYPLLFLTLGIALRDKVVPPTRFSAIAVSAGEIDAVRIRCSWLEADQAVARVWAVPAERLPSEPGKPAAPAAKTVKQGRIIPPPSGKEF